MWWISDFDNVLWKTSFKCKISLREIKVASAVSKVLIGQTERKIQKLLYFLEFHKMLKIE